MRGCTSWEQVAQIGTRLQRLKVVEQSHFQYSWKTFSKHCTILCRCGCRHFENLKSLRYGMFSLSNGRRTLTIILHSTVKYAAVKWTVLTVSFVNRWRPCVLGRNSLCKQWRRCFQVSWSLYGRQCCPIAKWCVPMASFKAQIFRQGARCWIVKAVIQNRNFGRWFCWAMSSFPEWGPVPAEHDAASAVRCSWYTQPKYCALN